MRHVPPLRTLPFALLFAVLPGCGDGAAPNAARQPAASVPEPAPASARSTGSSTPLVVFVGDSLTAGLGLAEDQAYPSVAAAMLAERGLPVRVVNGGISGDTSAGALERIDWLLSRPPDVVVVAIGANDGLRGQPVAGIERNLRGIVRRSKESGAEVVVAGQKIPTNYGRDYERAFEALYGRVAEDEGVHLLPFLLEGVAMRPELNQPDGIHPNAEGQRILAAGVAAALEPILRARAAAAG